jgi:predicted ATPase/transcriptional regulator with XRE-family HTH domain
VIEVMRQYNERIIPSQSTPAHIPTHIHSYGFLCSVHKGIAMKRSYRDRDYSFGQMMLTLRSAIGLTQTGLAEHLGISRFAVGEWEAGNKYPKLEHLKAFIELAIQQGAFPAGYEVDEIRGLWKAAHQKALLDETWLAGRLASKSSVENEVKAFSARQAAVKRHSTSNLPFQAKPFVGRALELSKIAHILDNSACRLLTLIGPGGIGKTRLAIEIAARRADAFEDGVAFVALASVGTANQINQIVSTLGDALRLSFGGQSDPITYLLSYLREQKILLVLDNFEHLINEAELVNDILQHAPNVTILVTSRSRLNLQSEWLFDVEGLSYPSRDVLITLHTLPYLAEYGAVKLFVQRATQVQPRFSLSEVTLKSIIPMSQQLAGMPLAIELAAAAVRTLSIEMIAQQIRENLNGLSTTLRDIPERHRSMRAAFDHSWSLLNETERTLFSRLAVFHGSFTAEAAKQVAGVALFDLGTLIDKSLLRQSVEETYASVSRFMMLEPIHEYAMERLLEHGEYEMMQHSHAAYYLTLAENAGAHWYTPTAEVAIRELNREYDNLYTALVWSRTSHHPTIGLQIAVALTPLWKVRGFLSEGSEWLAHLLKLDADNQDAASLAVRVRALKCAARLATDNLILLKRHNCSKKALPSVIGLVKPEMKRGCLSMRHFRRARSESMNEQQCSSKMRWQNIMLGVSAVTLLSVSIYWRSYFVSRGILTARWHCPCSAWRLTMKLATPEIKRRHYWRLVILHVIGAM